MFGQQEIDTIIYKWVEGLYIKEGVDLFMVAKQNVSASKEKTFKKEKFRLNTRKNFLMVRSY